MAGPVDHFITLRTGLKLHYLEWGEKSAPPLVLLHGRLDIAHSWDLIAPELAKYYRVLALDLRGHGGSDFTGAGAHYTVPSFVWDVAALIEEVAGDGPVELIGHSLGGLTASHYTALFPEKVSHLVNIEGFGPMDRDYERTRRELRRWLERMTAEPQKERRPYDSLEEAAARLIGKESRQGLPREFALHLTRNGTEKGEDGKYRWRFDPNFRASRPVTFSIELTRYLWSQIACPTLIIVGTASTLPEWNPSWREVARCVPDVTIVELEGLAHMMHQTHPRQVTGEILKFLGKP